MMAGRVAKPSILVDCIGAARPPTVGEMENLATRVCCEIRPDAPDWSEVAVGSEAYRRTMCVARAAVGVAPPARAETK